MIGVTSAVFFGYNSLAKRHQSIYSAGLYNSYHTISFDFEEYVRQNKHIAHSDRPQPHTCMTLSQLVCRNWSNSFSTVHFGVPVHHYLAVDLQHVVSLRVKKCLHPGNPSGTAFFSLLKFFWDVRKIFFYL